MRLKITLNAKQQRFVLEYLKDLNATQAAIRAGYSKNTANEQGSRLLRNVSIKQAIAKKSAVVAEKQEISVEWVLEKLKSQAVSGQNESACTRAAELIGKHLGMFREKVDLNVEGELSIKWESS